MLELLTSRSIGDPVMLILIQALQSFDDDDENTENTRDDGGAWRLKPNGMSTAATMVLTLRILKSDWLAVFFLSYHPI